MPSPSEGAIVVRVPGTYDDAVRVAAAEASAHGWTVISDTSWPGYEHIPRLIMLGYSWMVDEMVRAMPPGLATGRHLRAGGRRRIAGGCRVPKRVAVAHASSPHRRGAGVRGVPAGVRARRDAPTLVPGPFDTVMGGLRCGEVSPLAFEAVAPLVDAYLGIDDAWSMAAMRRLARPEGRSHRLPPGPPAPPRSADCSADVGGPHRLRSEAGTRARRHVHRRRDRQRRCHRSIVVAPRGGRLMRRLLVALAVISLFAALTVALTWPQAAHLRTHVPPYDDSLLSIWRISWIAHALTSAAPLVDANIFHPELRTLAYTDAVLLQGLIAAPFIRGGASPVMVYNLLILGSIALSGAAMCLLAQRLTGSLAAGIVAGTIFAFVTFRFDHFMHLELQATIFLPLAVWCLDRAFESGRWRDMAGFGACLVLQVLSGIYYAVFLATALAVAIPWRWLSLPARPAPAVREADRRGGTGLRRGRGAVPGHLHAEPLLGRRARRPRGAALLRDAAELSVVRSRQCPARSVERAARPKRAAAVPGRAGARARRRSGCGAGRHGRTRSSSSAWSASCCRWG